jgi:hypothetical protein
MRHINQKGFGAIQLILVVVLIGLIGGTGYYVYRAQDKKEQSDSSQKTITNFDECVAAGNPVMESYPEQCAADGQTFVNEEQQFDNGWNTEATSGLGKFSLVFPDGFGEVIKPLDSDSFYLMGLNQPALEQGGKTTINEQDFFGTDAPSLFTVTVLENSNYDTPLGTVSDYTLVNGKENPIKGKKYSYIYEADEPEAEGIGQRRYKNDRNYIYIFPISDSKVLSVSYAVYSQDPRNNIETIEAIIDTIRLK